MVFADVIDAFFLHTRNELVAVVHKVQEFAVDVFFVRFHVDDGAELVLVDNSIIFRFCTAHVDESASHTLQRIHGRSVGVELVKDHFAVLHKLYVFVKWNGNGLVDDARFGTVRFDTFKCPPHNVGTFINRALLLYADEEAYGRIFFSFW